MSYFVSLTDNLSVTSVISSVANSHIGRCQQHLLLSRLVRSNDFSKDTMIYPNPGQLPEPQLPPPLPNPEPSPEPRIPQPIPGPVPEPVPAPIPQPVPAPIPQPVPAPI